MASFSQRLIDWQRTHGRHDLPWQGSDAYGVWLSEIMLQQTQVATVIPYYQRFIASFPTIPALAAATEEQVLTHWSGLGYYARGRNLHKAAQIIVAQYGGVFPRDFNNILELPGIGRSTAAAICALAYHESRAILDGNVKRVLARHCGIEGWTGSKPVEEKLWTAAEILLPPRDVAIYTQALMDLGATVCGRSKPKCVICPIQTDCVALKTDRVIQLPNARPKKIVPERQAIFLLLVHGDQIFLEKRSGNGIWGGLWCFPKFEDESDARDWFMHNKLHVTYGEKWELFIHTFTHFKLRITPLKIHLSLKALPAMKSECGWFDVEKALQMAIPTPIQKLLRML